MPVMPRPTISVCETRRIIEECYEQALATLRGSRDRLNQLAHTLLDRRLIVTLGYGHEYCLPPRVDRFLDRRAR
jgi:DNA-binding transcriptional LysR family regulator